MNYKFKVIVETDNSTVNYTVRDLEDDDFQEFKKLAGAQGIEELNSFLYGLRCEICADKIKEPK